MRVSVLRVCAVLEVACSAYYLVTTDYLLAWMAVLLAGFMWMLDDATYERDQLRKSRVITRSVDIHQLPGESREVFARRVVDECRRVDVWTKP